ncbi:MAG: hypothetical protein FJ255_11065, partial [Phycisphaerae bacterium]|nr:hypothetical protein [Phycisphaerae bacterium]
MSIKPSTMGALVRLGQLLVVIAVGSGSVTASVHETVGDRASGRVGRVQVAPAGSLGRGSGGPGRVFSLAELRESELARIVRDAGSRGATPERTPPVPPRVPGTARPRIHRVSRQRRDLSLALSRAAAAFAAPEVYEFLEKEGCLCANRLPANEVLRREIAYLLTRPVGRPPQRPIIFCDSVAYRAASGSTSRRVVAKVEWHAGELFLRVAFIVTNLRRDEEDVVRFYNGRGTAEQWIKEGKNAVKWTRLSCHDFADNHARLQLFAPPPGAQPRELPSSAGAARGRGTLGGAIPRYAPARWPTVVVGGRVKRRIPAWVASRACSAPTNRRA